MRAGPAQLLQLGVRHEHRARQLDVQDGRVDRHPAGHLAQHARRSGRRVQHLVRRPSSLSFLPFATCSTDDSRARSCRINGELVLSSSQVYYRNSAVGNIGTGPSNSSVVPPIDYDALSDSVTIPNGGFKPSNETGVFNPSFVTKVVGPTATATAEGYEDANGDITATSLPYDWEVRRARQRRRNVVPLATPTPTSTLVARRVVELDKRADTVATTVPGFLGAMCQTFFGGSSTDYVRPLSASLPRHFSSVRSR